MMGASEKIVYCGELGSGLSAKVSNHYLSETIILATSEAMNFGLRSEVDKHLLY